jgi:RNA 2',3'-cyclic 3'-phosphodiesterase
LIRLFVGIELPEAVRERLAGLRGGIPGAKWVPPENMHLTLRFIGEVEYGLADDLDAALAKLQSPRFDLTLDGVGFFGKPAAARTLWVGVRKCEALTRLQAKVEIAVQRLGLPAEERKYSPHVTLARLRGVPAARLQRFVEANGHFLAGPLPVAHFVLFSSALGSGNAVYTAEADYPLMADSGN